MRIVIFDDITAHHSISGHLIGSNDFFECGGPLYIYIYILNQVMYSAFANSCPLQTAKFLFHSFIATMSYSLPTSFNSLMKDQADKYHVWGTLTRSPSRSNSRQFKHTFFHTKKTHIHVFLYNICRLYLQYHI